MSRIILAIGVVLAAAPGDFALTCSCVPRRELSEDLKGSAAVFVGKVVEEKRGETETTFKVVASKGWKGIKGRDVILTTTNSTCRAGLEKDVQYLIFAYSNDKGGFEINQCNRISSLRHAADDLKELGKPEWEDK